MTIKIFTVAHVPEELQQAWLQHLRDFDTAHPGCHFEVGIDGPEATMQEMVALLQVKPSLTFAQIFKRTKWKKGDERGHPWDPSEPRPIWDKDE